MTTNNDSSPPAPKRNPDTHPGVTWWNSLPTDERRNWLRLANSACPADAYKLRCQLVRGIHGRAAV